MRRTQLGLAVGVATLLVAIAGPAVATSASGTKAAKAPKVPKQTVIAKTVAGGTPQMLVDSKGTVNIVWTGTAGHDSYGDSYFTVKYARKPAGARKFTQVKLPHVFDDDSYLLFQPSAGVLEMIVQSGANAIEAFRSTTDGIRWSKMNTAALNDPSLHAQNIYLEVPQLVAAPDGPIEFTGQDADGATEVVQINPALTTVTPVAVDKLSTGGALIGRTPGGATFQVARGSSSKVPFQVGSHTGQLTFPSCEDATNPTLAVGHSVAVVTEAGCGHVWSTSISTRGQVGHRVTIGASAAQSSGLAGRPWAEVVSDRRGHFTAAYIRPGGDLGVAHSSNGKKWKVEPRSVPIATDDLFGSGAAVSTGAATWFGSSADNGANVDLIRVIPLADTYRPPSPPSKHGIPHARRAHTGSLAVVAPGRVAVKHFRKTGRVTVRLVSALPDHVNIAVGDSRVKGNTTYDICGGGATAKLKPGKVKTVTLTCASGTIVIGGTSGSGVDAKKGDSLSFSFGGRNGALEVAGKVA
jgi:hypothetical protein